MLSSRNSHEIWETRQDARRIRRKARNLPALRSLPTKCILADSRARLKPLNCNAFPPKISEIGPELQVRDSAASGMTGLQPDSAFWRPSRQEGVGLTDAAFVEGFNGDQLDMESANRVQFGKRSTANWSEIQHFGLRRKSFAVAVERSPCWSQPNIDLICRTPATCDIGLRAFPDQAFLFQSE